MASSSPAIEPPVPEDSSDRTRGRTPFNEAQRPFDVQKVLRTDSVLPAPTLLEASDYDLGSAPLGVERYLSREFHDREVEKLWSKVWQYACFTHDIPNIGDVHVYRILNRSILIVRQRDKSLKAFVNSCLHRGRELCHTDTKRSQLRCPYHGFTWSLGGSLEWVPAEWDFPQVQAESFSLPQIRVEEWNGFIFVNFDDEAPGLIEYMGGMYAQWGGENPRSAWDFTTKYKAVHLEKRINCNWKVCMEGFLETLHVFASHPQLAEMVPESSTQYDVYPNEPHFSRFHSCGGMPSTALPKQPGDQDIFDSFTSAYFPHLTNEEPGRVREGETARKAFARLSRQAHFDMLGVDVTNMPEAELIDGTEYMLFPNFLPWPSLLNPLVYRFRPTEDPDWCIWDTMLFLPFAGERPPSAKVIQIGPDESFDDVGAMGALDHILEQDGAQLPLVQRGLKNSATGVVNLARYQEVRIRHYNKIIDEYLAR